MVQEKRHTICTRYCISKKLYKGFFCHLGKAYSGIKYSDMDFSSIYKIVDTEKDARDMMTKEDRKALAKKRKEFEKLKEQYGTAILDGEKVEVDTFTFLFK